MSLILFMIALSSVVTVSLFRIILGSGYKQFSHMAAAGIQLISERMDNVLFEEIRRIENNDDISTFTHSIDKIFTAYYEEDIIPAESLTEFSRSANGRPVFLPGSKFLIERSLNLLAKDKKIIYSTDQPSLGTRFSPEKPEDRRRLDRFLKDGFKDTEYMTILENDQNIRFNLFIIFPIDTFLPDTATEDGFFMVAVRNLDINRSFSVRPGSENKSQMYTYNGDGQITFAYPGRSQRVNLKKREKLSRNFSGEILVSKPFINETGDRVLSGSLWLKNLGLGIIFEQPADEILAPWYLMSALILAIMILSFLIFFIITILLEKKRIQAYDHNPLTHLPGNRSIMEQISSALSAGQDSMIIYCDLDNFKAYNDLYGFSAGDDVIIFSSELLAEYFKPSRTVFLGHIGGDDFIVIGPCDILTAAAALFGPAFDDQIKSFYSREDGERGYIESKNRQGRKRTFPLIAMSMGGVKLGNHPDSHPLRITEICAEVKKQAKKVQGSSLVLDSRIDIKS